MLHEPSRAVRRRGICLHAVQQGRQGRLGHHVRLQTKSGYLGVIDTGVAMNPLLERGQIQDRQMNQKKRARCAFISKHFEVEAWNVFGLLANHCFSHGT